MPALDFPNSPALNQIHTENGRSFKWDGVSWNAVDAAAIQNKGKLFFTGAM